MYGAAAPVAGRSRVDQRSGPENKMRKEDPYFGYIANNVRLREP